ncbi:HNH endonuclease signature motif containing protein [Mesorhizobium sp. B1-1-6]|uniref:HNH endonuclease signature motif containing protein n=1 Tax=Mesorhizobium sp. B1-1-6 TaxID=2589978 RepID=UPI00112E30C2|nr:HNH endonuclease signature motif containing protein [Mesorhizobium sp. B1-1-6]TPN34783.1 HNH endonuclease [Mesorhizobium sp. B1-1-6]
MAKQIGPQVRQLDMRTAMPAAKKADAELLTPQHRAWRDQVLRRANHRCEAIDDGRRCATSAPSRLFADHIIERKDGGAPLDVANGQCLCGKHHTLKTAAARAGRMKERY